MRKIDKIHLVSCGEFEDLLPKPLIIKTVNSLFKNFLTINEQDFDSNLSNAKILEDIFYKEPYNSRTLYELVMCYKEVGDSEKALDILEKQILAGNSISSLLMEIYNNLKAN